MNYAPLYIMLGGLPGSGKSTMRRYFRKMYDINHIASSDDIIESECKKVGKNYSEGFSEFITFAQKKTMDGIKFALKHDFNILDDQTNLTIHGRNNKLKLIPSNYIKIYYYFPIPNEDEWRRRLNSRAEKIITNAVLESMKGYFIMPTLNEGFDMIYTVNGFKI